MAKRGKGIALLSIGCVLLVIAGAWLIYNVIEDNNAGKQSAAILEKMEVTDNITSQDISGSVEIDGDLYCGKVVIDNLAIELPVHQKWDYKRLKTAPCRYSGSVKTNDMIIVAHNYKSHFGPLSNAKIGNEVKFIDAYGKSYTYEICKIESIDGLAVSDMQSGGWDLTLFTCNKSGKLRVTIRCKIK